MANTPKPLRRRLRAETVKRASSADWWASRATSAASRAAGNTSDQEAQILSDQQFIAGGSIPITYTPTNTIDPSDPRTVGAGYDSSTRTLRVEWGDGGAAYNYYNVPPEVWNTFQKVPSPGKYINSVLNYYKYGVA